MFLQRLCEYADRLDMPPPMYQSVPIRYIIELDHTGSHPNIVDTATPELKRGKPRPVPDLKRTVAITPKLLADNAEYVLGVAREESKPDRVRQQHEEFVALVRNCATMTGEPEMHIVLRFLETLDLAALRLPEKFDPSANMTFEVDGVYPTDLRSVRAYWAKVAAVPDDTPVMECLVCGRMRPPVARLPISIKGIPGGQSSGMALISANARAFESYGLEASLIAPTCEECGQRFGNALNALIRGEATHLYAAPLVYIFWTREQVAFTPGKAIERASDDDVQQFLTAPWRSSPQGPQLAVSPFYAASLSASGARVVLRDWIEVTLEKAQENLTRYFRLQCLRDAYTGELRWFGLRQLARATINSNSIKEEPPAQVNKALLHQALYGGDLPIWLLYQAVRRVRAEQGVTAARAALMKMVLLSQWDQGDKTMSDLADMPELTDRERRAYMCGRLLTIMDEIQREALGKNVNATVVDRYYGTASSAPASVFGRLMRGTQANLGKLRREREGTYRALDGRLQDILDHLRPSFPSTLTLREQGLFALGFYHQKAEGARARKEYAKRNTGRPDGEVAATDTVSDDAL